MFEEPVDPGLAESDRAVTNVERGTDTPPDQSGNTTWYEGGGRKGERARQPIVTYPPTRGLVTQGDPFEAVKIGVLVDMDLGQLLADWLDPTILAIEDALNEGVYDRPVQIVVAAAGGLPRENYLKCRKGYEWLGGEGGGVGLGPLISAQRRQPAELSHERRWPPTGW